MKEVMLKSLKHNTITTIILAIVCAGLVALSIVQNIQYNKMLKQQTEKYTELMIEQQPDIQDFPNRKLGRFTLSWYSPKELGKTSPSQLRTSTGTTPKEGRTIAVDPKLIPYGSIVYIQDYGYFIAEDCGGDIKSNRIDIFTASHENAIQQGKKVAQVWILGKI
jgi:3D (Asp-Asp-Asp) domain-containing protein